MMRWRRRFGVLALIALLPLASAQPAAALDEKKQGLVLLNTNLALAAVEREDWDVATYSFSEAINHYLAAGEEPPSESIFNLALAYDTQPGGQLAAAFWYEAYLALAPHVPDAGMVRDRITVLLREFDAMQTAKIDLTEKVFREILAARGEWRTTLANDPGSNLQEFLAKEDGSTEEAIRNVATALIYMGNTRRAQVILEAFDIPAGPDGELAMALVSLGQIETARAYETSKMSIEELDRILSDFASKQAERCIEIGRFRTMLTFDDFVMEASTAGDSSDARRDIDRADTRAAMLRNFDAEYATAQRYVHFTHAIRTLAVARWTYRAFRESCG